MSTKVEPTKEKPVRIHTPAKTKEQDHQSLLCCSRRQLLLGGGAWAATMLLGEVFPGRVAAQEEGRPVQVTSYPRIRIAKLSQVAEGRPLDFLYPDDGPHSISTLVKLGERAGGGIGPDQDIVAFNTLCPHQGGSLRGAYDEANKVAGPCPIHLTTFDLTRHGMVVSGHATESLPQVILEIDGEDIYAVGVLGLIYGYPSNVAFVKRS